MRKVSKISRSAIRNASATIPASGRRAQPERPARSRGRSRCQAGPAHWRRSSFFVPQPQSLHGPPHARITDLDAASGKIIAHLAQRQLRCRCQPLGDPVGLLQELRAPVAAHRPGRVAAGSLILPIPVAHRARRHIEHRPTSRQLLPPAIAATTRSANHTNKVCPSMLTSIRASTLNHKSPQRESNDSTRSSSTLAGSRASGLGLSFRLPPSN